MRAKLINEGLGTGEFTLEEMSDKLSSDQSYARYKRFEGIVTGTIIQLASELGAEKSEIRCTVIDKSEASDACPADTAKTYMDETNNKYRLRCKTCEGKALVELAYDKNYAKYLYGALKVPPLRILIRKI